MIGPKDDGGRYASLHGDTAGYDDDQQYEDGRRDSIQSFVLESISRHARRDDEEATLYEARLGLKEYNGRRGSDLSSSGRDTDDAETAPERPHRSGRAWRIVLWVAGGFGLIVAVAGLLAFLATSSSEYRELHELSLEEQRHGLYRAQTAGVQWIAPVGDSQGDIMIDNGTAYSVARWESRNDTTFIAAKEIKDPQGRRRHVEELWLNQDRSKALVQTDRVKNWRHSSFGLFWILDVGSGAVEPVYTDKPAQLLSLAEWSPRGDRIAFVAENNMYLRYVGGDDDGKVEQVTTDGGDDVFYGRPDWVYEEEVFSGAKALWWSQTGEYLAFLRTNDSEVPEFPIPYFVQAPATAHGAPADAYPELRRIKYPKPGFSNPVVEMQFLEVSSGDHYTVAVEENPARDNLITEVVWTDGSQVLVRLTTRESDKLMVSVVDAKERSGKIVRTLDAGADGGWFEVTQDTKFVPAGNGRDEAGYIDTVVVDGYNHLAYFSPVDAAEPKVVLTRGEWEVDDAPAAVDLDRNIVYFTATKTSPVERHLFAVNLLDGSDLRNVTDVSQDGYYSASFSVDARYALLSYRGPDVPWQGVVDLSVEDPLSAMEVIEDNKALRDRLANYSLPSTTYSQVEVADGVLANAVEIRPPNFDPNRKYPVVFFVYGGPISQTVTKEFKYDFQKVFSAVADAVVVTVDGRGTGFMGRQFRAVVRDNLGHYEVLDQISGAKIWAERSYVDASRIAIWGWSYGGYMTLRTLEADAGNTFSYGVAVAPVTDWRFYDSIYTERYMHTPEHNADGYAAAAVTNMTALGQNKRFLLMHGTGDDNVHFQNSLTLLDKLDEAGVENYDVHVFPDSDHSIFYHNANSIVYDKISHWLQNAFEGRFKDLH